MEEWEGGSLFLRFKRHFIFKEDFNNKLLSESKQLLDWNRQKGEDSSDEEDDSDDESSSETESEGESSSDEDN